MKILFICTHNRCRSILCEAITNNLANGRITAYSAGSQPASEVHPLTLKYLKHRQISTEGLYSQSWDEFNAIAPDIVITVCDSAANEACPVWLADTVKVHWALSDPSKLQGTDSEIQAAFFSLIDTIKQRIQAILNLNFEAMSQTELQSTLQNLAKEN